MRKFQVPAFVASVILLFTFTPFAQASESEEPTDIDGVLHSFAEDMGAVFPAFTDIGMQWSLPYSARSYLLSWPLGIGVTTGAVAIPEDVFHTAAEGFGTTVELGVEDETLETVGLPLMATTLEVRLGTGDGQGLGIDIGGKIGMAPSDADGLDTGREYQSFMVSGLDVRVGGRGSGLLQPKLAFGLGIGYSSGHIALDGLAGERVHVDTVTADEHSQYQTNSGDEQTDEPRIYVENPTLYADWETDIPLEFQAQGSIRLLFLRPFLGAKVSGFETDIETGLHGDVVDQDGQELDSDLESQALSAAETSIHETGIGYRPIDSDAITGTSFRIFGGLGVNLWVINADLGASYDVPDGPLGVQLTGRIEL